jgi:hypothetical protein
MNPRIVRILLNLYIVVQSAVYATFLIFFIKNIVGFICSALLGTWALCSAAFGTALLIYFVLANYLLVLTIGPFSIVATIKLKKQKALSKWYKFSIISFPTSILIILLAYSMWLIERAIQQH